MNRIAFLLLLVLSLSFSFVRDSSTGSKTTPNFSFSSDTNTGFYRIGADKAGITAGGGNVATFDVNGVTAKDLTVSGTSTMNIIKASGAITGASYSGGTITGTTISGSALQVNGLVNTNVNAGLSDSMREYSSSVGSGYGTVLSVSANNSLGFINQTSSSWATGTKLPNQTLFGGNGSNGTGIFSINAIKFYANSDAWYNTLERMTISPDGNVGIGTTAPSTKLEVAGTVSANEFGSGWTSFTPTTDALTVTFSIKQGEYKLVGRTVFFKIGMVDTSVGAGTGAITIGGFPYPIKNTVGGSNMPIAIGYVFDGTNYFNVICFYGTTGYMRLYKNHITAYTTIAGANRSLDLQGSYETP